MNTSKQLRREPMPQIKFKGFQKEEIAKISQIVTKEMAQIMDTPEDWFQIEFDPTVVFLNGEEVKGDPTVQVWWFERGQEVQDKAAKELDNIVKKLGYHISVISFHHYPKTSYYENGEHF